MTKQSNDNQKIETLIMDRIIAIKSQDIDKAVSDYSDDLLMFDVVGELAVCGSQAARERLTIWFATMRKLIDYEIRIVNIVVDNTVTYCNNFNRIVAITKDGKELNMWWRETLCLKKHNDNWLIFSAHSSVPFDGQTGKASTGLRPSENFKIESDSSNFNLTDLVKNIFHAYEAKDRAACEKMLTYDFTFTSPNNDNHINKDAYFERCWAFSEENPVFEFEKIAVNGNDVFALYNCKTKTGKKFRNTELFKFNRDKIMAIEVYFGESIL
jgi:ketosteroid isomerase-like protein